MKASELMIGDWVLYPNKTPQQIFGIAPEITADGATEDGFFNGCEWYPLKDAKPIPITPEILEKNEFHEESTGRFIARGLGGLLINWEVVIMKSAESMCLEIEAYSAEYNNFSGVGFLFVHELQHALRLCGIEKEIVL